MLRIAVCGPYNADNVLAVARNMKNGIMLSLKIAQLGMRPYCPWLDLQWALMSDMPIEVFRRLSLEEIKVSDAVLLAPGWQDSQGTLVEIEEAKRLNVPTFGSIRALLEWAKSQRGWKLDSEYIAIIHEWQRREEIS